MKLSNNSNFFSHIPDWDTRFAKMKELGFDAVDFTLLAIEQPCYESYENMENYCRQVRAAAEKQDIEIYQIHGPWSYTDDATPEGRAKVWEAMRKSIFGCHLLGCRYMVIHPIMPYGTRNPEENPELPTALTYQLLKDMLPECEKYGVVLCLENMPFGQHRLASTQSVVEMVKKIDSPYVQICFDTGHSHKIREDIAESVRLAAPYLKTLHVHDNWFNDEHNFPFLGATDWDDFAKALVESGYDGTLNLEVWSISKDMSPGLREAYIKLAVESAKQLNQLIESYKK